MVLKVDFTDGRAAQTFDQDVVAVGRDDSNDVILGDKTVSRHHAALVRYQTNPDRWFIRDLGSLRGTRVGGHPVDQAEVRTGSTLTLGSIRLVLTLAVPAHPAPAGDWFPYRIVEPRRPGSPRTAGSTKTEPPSKVKNTLGWLDIPYEYQDFAQEVLKQIAMARHPKGALDTVMPLLCGRTKASRGCALVFEPQGDGTTQMLVCGVTDPSRQIAAPGDWETRVQRGDMVRTDQMVSIPLRLADEVRGTICLECSDNPASVFSQPDADAIRHIGELILQASPTAPPAGATDCSSTEEVIPWPMKVVGVSPEMRRVQAQVQEAATGELRILIQGETGVGKSLLAEEIHRRSGRQGILAQVNAAAIPPETLEAQLFGFGRHAPWGHIPPEGVPGQIERADGGTFFFDEIGDTPVTVQVKLLTSLLSTNKTVVKRIGPHGESKSVDIKCVSATTVDLNDAVQGGAFRRELYNRIAGLLIRIPPLRERKEDIPVLAHFFLDNLAAGQKTRSRAISREAVQLRCERDWPNNVLELHTCISRAAMKNHPVIGPEDLEFDAPARAVTASALEVSGSSPAGYVEKPLRQVVLDHIMETLKHTGGNKEKSARILNISVMTLYDTLDRGRLPRNFGHGKPLFSPGEEQLRSEIMRVLEATQGDISRAALQLQFGDARELVSEMDRLWIPRRHGSPAEESGWGQDVRETTANGPESPGNFCRPG